MDQTVDRSDGNRTREELILEQEGDYRNIFREMADGLALHEIVRDTNGRPVDYRLLAANSAFERITGFRSDQIVGKTILEVAPETERFWIETFSRVALTGEPAYFENYSKELDKHFEVSTFRPLPGKIACIFRDITERKKAEDALRQSEEKFRKIYESSIVGIFQSVPEGRFIDVNPAFAAMLGYDSPQELLSSISDIENQYYLYPEDRRRYQQMIETQGYVENIEYKVRGKNGLPVWVNNSSRAHIGQNGVISHYEGIVVNITKQKEAMEALRESETRLRFAGRLAQIGGWSVNLSENRVQWSDEVAAIYDMPPGFYPPLKTVLEFYAPEFRKKITEAFTACAQNGTPYDEEMQIITAMGKRVWIRTIGVAQRDEFGKIIAVKGAFQDISDRRQSQEAMKQLNETLAQRNALLEARAKQLQHLTVELIEAEERERRKFAHLLHDDLQQMLAAAKMKVQAVSDRLPPEQMLAQAAQLLEESIAKARRLSHELSPAVLHQSGLNAAFRWLVTQIHEQFGVTIQLEILSELHLESATLKVFLFRSVQELLFNIVKHAGVKSGQVSVKRSNGLLIIGVSDQGKGFDPEILESNCGIGFGLMTIRERASHIGGNLIIKSDPGQGSCFTLTIPISPPFRATETTKKKPDQLPFARKRTIDAAAGTVRVLFVDDHKVMRQGLIQLIANQADIQVVGEAANGQEAIFKARRLRPNVIVMDVSMPLMDGIEATRRIKAEMPNVRIIGLSMFEDEHVSAAMRRVGAEAFISKTASTSELIKAINAVAHHTVEKPLP